MGWAEATRDVVMHATSKGQLLSVIVAGWVGLFVWKLPEKKIGELADRIVDHLVDGSLLGWALSVALLFGWVFHTKSLRRSWNRTLDRVTRERNKYQDDGLKDRGKRIESSKRKRTKK